MDLAHLDCLNSMNSNFSKLLPNIKCKMLYLCDSVSSSFCCLTASIPTFLRLSARSNNATSSIDDSCGFFHETFYSFGRESGSSELENEELVIRPMRSIFENGYKTEQDWNQSEVPTEKEGRKTKGNGSKMSKRKEL